MLSKILVFVREYSLILAWALLTWGICGWSPRGWAISSAVAIVLFNVGVILWNFMLPGGDGESDKAEADRE